MKTEADITKEARAGGLPAPLVPCFQYLDGGETPSWDGTAARLETEHNCAFDIKTAVGYPAFPLLGIGRIWHQAWDIPTIWVVDQNKQCWCNDAHGGLLEPCLPQDINQDPRVYRLLGMKPLMPEWVRTALNAGWTPPETFSKEEYST